ncbi:RhoGAP-domain-containing protein, partial [Fistulina hepatica ATCC 64428]
SSQAFAMSASLRTMPSSSTVNGVSDSQNLVTLESLLAANANSQDPTLAALEQAINERNLLSSQNSQLWKLVEKQRSAYNKMVDELKRVRQEREQYRNKITALTGHEPRKHRERAASTKTSIGENPENEHSLTPTRTSSDDHRKSLFTTLASSHPQSASGSRLHPSRSQEPFSSDRRTETPPPPPFSSLPQPRTHGKARISPITVPSPSLSRESRISLPDEARRYIANMVDSPVPSPKPDASFQRHVHKTSADPGEQSRCMFYNIAYVAEGDLTVSESEQSTVSPTLQEDDDDDDEIEEGDGDGVGEGFEVARPQSMAYMPVQVALELSEAQEAQRRKVEAQRVQMQQFQAQRQLEQPHRLQIPGADDNSSSSTSTSPYSQASPGSSAIPSPMSKLRQAPTKSVTAYAAFRELPLLSSDLPHTTVTVFNSFVRPNDRGKEVLSFVVMVDPGNGKPSWKVEKMYSDVLTLDQRVRSSVGKSVNRKIASLPEGRLWKDHAPARVDQRKAVLQNYFQSLISLPVKKNDEVIAFFTSDILREAKQPVMQVGHKEGYLTKRGKNFGGWKTRYFVLQGPMLEYYDCRGGAHLGSIAITNAQIGRQSNPDRPVVPDEEKEYRHAFLIVEDRKGAGGNRPRHVLCAESDSERDSWVELLVRYVTGEYNDEPVVYGSGTSASLQAPRPSVSSEHNLSNVTTPRRPPPRASSGDTPNISKGSAVPISQLAQDASNAKLFSAPRPASPSKFPRSGSPSKLDDHKRMLQTSGPHPSSLPDSSPLSNAGASSPEPVTNSQRANSEMGHYPDLQEHKHRHSPERHRHRSPEQQRQPRKLVHNSHPSHESPVDRVPSPEKGDRHGETPNKTKISAPLNGAKIPAGYKFGGKDMSSDGGTSTNDRREKAKSRSFWNFGRSNAPASPPRAVFGVPLEESLDVTQIANLPAIVFRAIQYLESKQAELEEGIYRLSGSSAVIKSLKDRFNAGDIDLLASDEYWDPHAIAGLLKTFLRELPSSILTRDLHLKFLAVMDFAGPQERIRELTRLIASLPLANYSLLRALTAHLILIVQNSSVNKMTIRNVGIVFSPTLGIPAGVFSLMLGEFNRVFAVDVDDDTVSLTLDDASGHRRRNSQQYSDAAADELLGLAGRTLSTPAEEDGQSDADGYSLQDESGAEKRGRESSRNSPLVPDAEVPDTPTLSKASDAASRKGLSLNVPVSKSDRGNRYSRVVQPPVLSPRPPTSPT